MKFKFLDINFYVSYWSLAILSYAVITSGNGQTLILMCLLSSLFHEIGHLVLIIRFKRKPSEIRINPFEVRICCNLTDLSLCQDVLVSVAGVTVNFILYLYFQLLYRFYGLFFLSEFSLCNLFIGLFNILPISSTDGGQILYLYLSKIFTAKTVSFISGVVTCVVLIPLIISGVYVMFISRYNLSLLFIGIYFLVIFINKELW